MKTLKKIQAILLASIFSMSYSYCQDTDTTETEKVDTTSFYFLGQHFLMWPEEKPDTDTIADTIEDRSAFIHWLGIDIGINGYLNKDNTLELPEEYDFLKLKLHRSISVSINFFEKNINLYKNYVNLVTGLGFEFNNYRFEGNITLIPGYDTISFIKDTISIFKKNKLTTTFLNLPLLLEFNTGKKPNKSFHFATGMIFGVKLRSYTKQVFETEDKKNKLKVVDDFNLSPFKLGVTVRIGYGNLNFFANYSLSGLFEEGKGPELHPFTAGISLDL